MNSYDEDAHLARLADMSDEGVQDFIDLSGEGVARIIKLMEEAETWTLDKNSSTIQAQLQDFAKRLAKIDVEALARDPKAVPKLFNLFAYVSYGRTLKMMTWANVLNKTFIPYLLVESRWLSALDGDSPRAAPPKLMYERFHAIQKANLLSEIYCEERCELLNSTIESLKQA